MKMKMIYQFLDTNSGISALFDSREKAENFAQQIGSRLIEDAPEAFSEYKYRKDYVIYEYDEINPDLDDWYYSVY